MSLRVPEHLRANWQRWFGGEQALQLIASCERRLAAAIADWGLDELEPLGPGEVAVVCSCRYRGQPAVLKVSPRPRDQRSPHHETDALRLWTGLAPLVLASRDEGWTALLERLEPGVPLADCRPQLEALEILGELARKLHRYPAGAPFPSLATGGPASRWRSILQGRPDVVAELDELLATAGDPVVLHLDLHPNNVLLDRERWRVIDPRPHRGDRHAECFVFLALAARLPDRSASETVDEWLSRYCTAAALDEGRVRGWTKVWARAELGRWPKGKPGWGEDMARLLAALDTDDAVRKGGLE